jgi:hypothetical protein
MTDAERRLARGLAWMCQQYLMRNGKLTHEFMSAGEDALELLAERGFVELEPGGGVWTKAGGDLLDED